jgi:molybdopterin/thiamine biosynthesis adenylyltransferase/rhodanese-related sulfurtransferase
MSQNLLCRADPGIARILENTLMSAAPNAVVERARHSELTPQEVARYSRHLIMPEVASEGQKKLKASRVLLIGAGGLGSPLALYLAAAGVGRIGLVDFDVVDFSNLQRQIIHGTADVGRPKLDSARDSILAINPEVQVDLYQTHLSSANAFEIFKPYDVVIDGTDNFPTRYLVNDACVLLHKPNVYGSIFRFDGQASVFFPPAGPCYRCLYPEPPPPGEVPSCAEGGVLGILPGLVGCIQATEGIKILLGVGSTLIGRLLLYDAMQMKFQEFKVRRNPKCPLCGENPTITKLIDYDQFCGVHPPEPEVHTVSASEITVQELKRRMDAGENLTIIDVRNPEEFEICRIPGSKLLPLPELSKRFGELDPAKEIILHCKSGGRSGKAQQFLREQGFEKTLNVKGGILAWADNIDRAMPKY